MADQIDRKIKHPDPDTSPNENKDGKPPLTWNPKKVTKPSEDED